MMTRRVHIRWDTAKSMWIMFFEDGPVKHVKHFESFFCKMWSVEGLSIEGTPKNYICIEFNEFRCAGEDKMLFL